MLSDHASQLTWPSLISTCRAEATLLATIVVSSFAAVKAINLHAHDKETDGLICSTPIIIVPTLFTRRCSEGCILRYEQATKVKLDYNTGKGYTNTAVCLTKFL